MKHLGKSNKNFDKPSIKILDKIKNKEKENFLVRFSQPEFTCICPVTSQPDFAHIVIDYVPNKWIVESKSLKLYFQSFRNHQSFHEEIMLLLENTVCSLWIIQQLLWVKSNTPNTPMGEFERKNT